MKFSHFCDLIKRYPGERVQIFVDQSNLYKAVQSEYGRKLDYSKLAQKLLGDRKLVRINIYISELNPDKEETRAASQQRFIHALRCTPFVTVRTRPLRYNPDDDQDKWEKGIDILVATDMLSQAYANGYDSMILISGDGDYAPVLEEIKKMGKRVENAFLKRSRSAALISVCDVFLDLDEKLLRDCFVQKTK